MQLLNDHVISLQAPVNTSLNPRYIEIDLASKIPPTVFALTGQFEYGAGSFASVAPDPVKPNSLIVGVNNEIKFSGVEEEVVLTYYANSYSGTRVKGRIVFAGQDFDISATPINFEIDTCTLPTRILINVQKYNNNLPVDLTSVGSNNTDAGTVSIIDDTESDYNNDYNSDFGGRPDQTIQYLLDADFWKALEGQDQFEYTISYRGKSATNLITITKKINK